jgi:uncharacterized protein
MNYVPPRRSDGTIQKRREPLPWPKDRPFRILSIDGGGICGILPAALLGEIERRFLGGRSIAGYFDMVAGTSTGGIIALALGAGMTAAAIRDIYVERGGIIFPPRSWPARALLQLRRLIRYGYDAKALEAELSRIFHSRVFGDTSVRLCIPSFEGRHGEPWIYKTPHHPDYRNDRHEKMVKVGLATAAAPTFFQALEHDGYMMVDGGLWANNPIMNALVDVLACFELERSQIQIRDAVSRHTTPRGGWSLPVARRDPRRHARSIAQRPRPSLPTPRQRSRDENRCAGVAKSNCA